MRILFLSPYVPMPPNFGGAMRIYHLLNGLAKNHEITLLTFGSSDKLNLLNEHAGILYKEFHLVKPTWAWKYRRVAQFFSLFSAKSFFSLFSKSRLMQNKIDELLASKEFDLIQIEFPIMANFDFNNQAIKILDEHNIEFDNFRRMWERAKSPLIKFHYYREFKKYSKEEIRLCKKMDAVLTVSSRDKLTLEKEVQGVPKFVVPNGVDSQYFFPSADKPEPYSMVFTGMMGYVPNHDGMHYFLDEIFPLILKEIPDAKIYIVGSRPPKSLIQRSTENIIVTGYVPDVRPYVGQASLYVVPLRMGGGTRLKVLEALSMRKPVVATNIGCEGIDVVNGESILISDDPAEFASKVVSVLRHPDSVKKLTDEGGRLVRSKYDWKVVSEQLEEVLQIVSYEKAETWNSKKIFERTG